MGQFPIDVKVLTAAGLEALERGDAQTARAQLVRATSSGAATAETWFGLSRAQRLLGAAEEENAALDRALRQDPQYLPALIAKGDFFTRAGDPRAADSYYGGALKVARAGKPLSPGLRHEIERVEAALQRSAQNYEAYLRAALDDKGFGAPGTERFAQALDLLLGKRKIYLQRPQHFYFPELPHRQFYEREMFPWVSALESATDDIRAELGAVLETGTDIAPYVEAAPNRADFNAYGMLNNPDWSAFYLIKDGAEMPQNTVRCPRTMAALKHVPLCRIDGRTPSVLFSLLRPGTRIPPHHGSMNTRLICHLPLIVPPDCGLRVGNETRTWREGRLALFDDSIEHEAWNLSAHLRVVLIFDVWKPELSDVERMLVATMLASINRFSGGKPGPGV